VSTAVASAVAPPTGPAESVRGPWKDAWRRLRRNRLALAGGLVALLVVLACVFLPALLGLDEEHQDLTSGARDQAPSWNHWFGTDGLGRDYAARVLAGGRFSLLVGLVGTLVCVLIGTVYGAVSGYYGGRIDDVMMRVVDFLYGIPYMFLVILIILTMADSDRNNPVAIFAALGLVQWLTMARIVRGQVMTLRHQEFVQAAHVMGAGDARVIFRHILPNCAGPIVVYGTLQVASMILLEAFLSYLGLGSKLSWGILVADANVVNPIESRWWLLLFPASMLGVTLLSLNFLGDGLRDALDPKTRR
jgi:oligopeptide transport system permease protein